MQKCIVCKDETVDKMRSVPCCSKCRVDLHKMKQKFNKDFEAVVADTGLLTQNNKISYPKWSVATKYNFSFSAYKTALRNR